MVSKWMPGVGVKHILGKAFSVALAAVVAVAPLSVGGVALAANPAAPFFENADALRTAYGTESTAIRLEAALAVADDEEPEELAELLEEGIEPNLALFAGSLEAEDASLYRELTAELNATVESAEVGDRAGLIKHAERAQELVWEAQDAVIPAERWADPAFVSALMSTIILWEGGVAEGFEEAVEEGEDEEYLVGWTALQRVKAQWDEVVSPVASDADRTEIEEVFAELDALFPQPEAPELFVKDPEEGETWGQLIVGKLEGATQAQLFPARDIGQLVAFVHDLSEEACGSYADGNALLGLEQASWAGIYYEQYLADPVGLFAPEPAEAIEQAFDKLTAEGSAEESAAACGELLSGLTQVRSVFGG